MNTTRAKTTAKQTAAQAYNDAQDDLGILLDCIEVELASHRQRAEAEPGNWGRVGDLQHMRSQLKQTLGFLMNWGDEQQTDQAIEEHLAEMRG